MSILKRKKNISEKIDLLNKKFEELSWEIYKLKNPPKFKNGDIVSIMKKTIDKDIFGENILKEKFFGKIMDFNFYLNQSDFWYPIYESDNRFGWEYTIEVDNRLMYNVPENKLELKKDDDGIKSPSVDPNKVKQINEGINHKKDIDKPHKFSVPI